jgi:hypothetical protein
MPPTWVEEEHTESAVLAVAVEEVESVRLDVADVTVFKDVLDEVLLLSSDC